MRTEADAILSLQRYVAQAFPEPWQVLLELDNEAEIERPFVVVSEDGDSDATGRLQSPWAVVPYTIYAYPEPAATRRESAQRARDVRSTLWDLFRVGVGDGRPLYVPLWSYDGRCAVQRITPEASTVTLTADGDSTAPIAMPAQPRHVREALEDLDAFEPGQLQAFGRFGGPYSIRFGGDLQGQDVPLLTATGADVDELAAGSPEPWRNPRDYAEVDRGPLLNTLPDPADQRVRTVTCGVRLTWGRGTRVPSSEMILRRIRVQAA